MFHCQSKFGCPSEMPGVQVCIYFKLFVPGTILGGSKIFIASPVSFMHVYIRGRVTISS